MRHTPHCIEETARWNQAIEAYKRTWPNYCQECNGEGQIVEYDDPSPPGISLGAGWYVYHYPCKHCAAKGHCPRCGALAWQPANSESELEELKDSPCSQCGWNWGKNEGDVMPQPYECACYELAASSWEAEQAEQDASQRMLRGE